MRYYKVSEDWISHLEGEFRQELIANLRSLRLERLQKYPPPKLIGLRVGNEPRIFSRYIRGSGLQLEPSALSSIYRSKMSSEEQLLYRAFRMNDSLPFSQWESILGTENIDRWVQSNCLKATGDGSIHCAFTVTALDEMVFLVDPLMDHGHKREPDLVDLEHLEDPSDVQPFFHTYIGLDSLRMIEWMEHEDLPESGRYLDCGTGAGGLLLYFGRRFDEAIGIDINPRAAKLARFNAELNKLENFTTICGNAIDRTTDLGEFDLVSWNLPFIFMPEHQADQAIDGFGGDMGIALCLKFLETLPPLLSDNGVACIAALAPILDNGENILGNRLREMLPNAGLDCKITVAQTSFAHTDELWKFHRAHKIRKFESVYLTLKPGSGRMTIKGPPFKRKIVDTIRERMYKRKYERNGRAGNN